MRNPTTRMFRTSMYGLAAVAVFVFMAGKSDFLSVNRSLAPDDSLMVTLKPDEAAQKVDVFVGGEPFTSYLFTDKLSVLKKTILYPLRTARGTVITRGYPLEPREGERVDHPHHIGMWFNYGHVNGLDFWNNSDAIPDERKEEMGTIVHGKINASRNGAGQGTLDVTEYWKSPEGKTLLQEDTRFIFHAEPNFRYIDRITRLTAQDEAVSLKDNKEGLLGIRIARSLEHPSKDKVEVFTDAAGKETTVEVKSNDGITGHYSSSEGLEGDDVWGTRGRWVMLDGVVDGEQVTLAILDHPSNVGYPAYWHARGYGLFAINPLGPAAFTDGKQNLNYALGAGQSVTFRYRVLIYSGNPSKEEIESRFQVFSKESV